MKRLVWRGLDAPRMEIAHVEVEDGRLHALGTQIGVSYELRYELEEPRLRAQVVGERELELDLEEGRDHFDLGYSPLFNTLPLIDGLDSAGSDYVMAFVRVPSLEVERSEQRYEPLGAERVRFSSGSFVAELETDADGFVVRYEGLAERVR
jgi:hypothetical protein